MGNRKEKKNKYIIITYKNHKSLFWLLKYHYIVISYEISSVTDKIVEVDWKSL